MQLDGNVVRFRGAIATSGTSSSPFVLPPAFRPKSVVYVPVDMCGATSGRLYIQPSGAVIVQPQSDFTNAACFTSLDGVSFAKNAVGFRKLALQNGWTGAPYSTSAPAVGIDDGVVRFKGAISGGTTAQLFVLPPAFRPPVNVYLPVDLCNANKGRLVISPGGAVTVQAATEFANAQCFTSLDGASFSLSAPRALVVRNGWAGAPFGTAVPGVDNNDGVVRFRGAIATSGTNAQPFTLPVNYRPVADTYVKVDLCNAANGRLLLRKDGSVYVQAEGEFATAQCFTSLDGASFVQ